MTRLLYGPLVLIQMVLQWGSATSLTVACWLTDPASASPHNGLLPSAIETGD